jgi:DNA-binding HxlR family transcriptional regulator
MRYTDLQHDLIVTSGENLHAHTLTDTLEWLRARHYVEKHQDARSADYRLTVVGGQLARILSDIESMMRQFDQAD